MGESIITRGLRSLAESLGRIKTLQVWAELKRNERKPDQPPSFCLDDHLAADLRTEYGFFVKTAMDIHEVLNKKGKRGVSERTRQLWQRRLLQLETELRRLDIPVAL